MDYADLEAARSFIAGAFPIGSRVYVPNDERRKAWKGTVTKTRPLLGGYFCSGLRLVQFDEYGAFYFHISELATLEENKP